MGSPSEDETQGQVRQLRFICHPEPRNEIKAWDFKGEEDGYKTVRRADS